MRLSKEMVNTIKKVDINDIINYIDEHVKDIYVSAYYSSLQGWHYDLLLDEDGDLDIAGPFGVGSRCMSTYKGTDIVLATISAYEEFIDFFTEDDIEATLDEEDKKALFEKCLEELNWNIDDLEEGYSLYDLYYEEKYTVEQVYENMFEEKYKFLKETYIDCCWDCFVRDELIRKIECNLEETRKYINDFKENYR